MAKVSRGKTNRYGMRCAAVRCRTSCYRTTNTMRHCGPLPCLLLSALRHQLTVCSLLVAVFCCSTIVVAEEDGGNNVQGIIEQQQAVLYEAGRHDGGPYESNVDILLQNPLKDNRDLLFEIGGFVDSDTCWLQLNASDANQNMQVSGDEYVAFAKAVVPDVLPEKIVTYDQLPLVYQLAFTSTACLCNNPVAGGDANATGCCSTKDENGNSLAYIRIPVQPSLGPNATETAYLYTVCTLAERAAVVYIQSAAPTVPPSNTPTVTPIVPSTVPTEAPTATSSAQPSTSPTTVPTTTVAPSAVTAPPSTTKRPTAAPSVVPSVAPPSAAPSSAVPPSEAPLAAAPSAAPITTPTVEPVMVQSIIPYDIALTNGLVEINMKSFVDEYLANLIAAFNTLAVTAATESSSATRRRQQQQQQRHLRSKRMSRMLEAVSVMVPTGFKNVDDIRCPVVLSDIPIDNTTLCQTVNALVNLTISGSNDTAMVKSAFEKNVREAIVMGDLQEELDMLMWASDTNPVTVLTGLKVVGTTAPAPGPREIQSGDALSPGAITGISLAALFFTLFPIGYYLFHRGSSSEDAAKPDYEEYEAGDDELQAANRVAGSSSSAAAAAENASLGTDAAQSGAPGVAIVGATTLGAAQAYYGKGGDAGEPGMLLDDEDDDDDDDGATSSNAGSSGWSSSAGISSLNTGSVDDSHDIAAAAGATLAGIGLASAFSRNLRDTGTPSDTDDGHSEVPSVSRDQLDSLIESGDWAAVGATAALLAAASDSQSGTSLSRASGSHARSRDSQSVDAARAAELDHLVDAGDWEGVVAAAAKFEAQAESGTASRSSKTNSSVESSAGSGSNTGTNTAGSPSVTTSLSDTASKAQKREEVRSEVEALVRRVVPEEIDNVDEMMNQFKGREEELVETLRTMQERAVAQKARAAGHRAAKTEARRSVQRGTIPVVQKVASLEIKEAASGSGGVGAAGVGMTAALAGVIATSPSKDTHDKKPAAVGDERAEKVVVNARSALEEAIEAGDWEAVGEAAAMISDNSVTTTSTGEIARLAGTNLSISTTGSNRSRNLSGVNADRASELDALIDRGDWSGVVAVANRFSETDKKDSEGGVRSKEEEEALKEAELWMKIADQKKAEGAMDAGASDAAEWAIQRSLSQLKEAEKKSEKKSGKADDEDEV